jgi:hypothetical protein
MVSVNTLRYKIYDVTIGRRFPCADTKKGVAARAATPGPSAVDVYL